MIEFFCSHGRTDYCINYFLLDNVNILGGPEVKCLQKDRDTYPLLKKWKGIVVGVNKVGVICDMRQYEPHIYHTDKNNEIDAIVKTYIFY